MAKKQKKRGKTPGKPTITVLPGAGLPAWMTNIRLQASAIFLLCVLLYANTFTHDFTLDDAIVLYDNEFTMQGIDGIDELLKYDTFRGFFKETGKENLVAGGRYRPLTPIMFATGIELFGKNPTVNHVMNVFYYGLTCVVFYLLLLKLFSGGKTATNAPPHAWLIALVAGLIFAAHPVHTEVVANIKGRDEIITLLGSLGGLYFSLRAYDEKRPVLNLVAGAIFFLGLMAKENAITFLAVVPLSYWVFTKANFKEIIAQTLPFVVAAGVFLAIRFSVLGFSVGEPVCELMNNPFLKLEGTQYVPFTFAEKMATIFYTLLKYIGLLLFPHPLTHDYYPRQIPIMTFANWQSVLSLLLYVGMGVYGAIRTLKKDPVGYGILVYLATLSIVSNIFFPIGTNMGERFIFMPSIGFALIAGILACRLVRRMSKSNKAMTFGQMKPVLMALGVLISLYAVKVVTRNMVWKDNFTLFTTDVKISPNSAKVRNSAGGELIAQAIQPEHGSRKEAMLREAVGHLKEAIRIHPGFKNAFLLLGNAHNYLQEYEAAFKYYEQALKLDPNYKEARKNLGLTYRDAGKFYGEQKGDLKKALEYLTKAYEILPDDYDTLRLLGVAYGIGGNHEKAIYFFEKAWQIQPENADAMFNLGTAYRLGGQIEKAAEWIAKAKAVNPKIEEERSQRK